MRIDISIIDKMYINKNKQFRLLDETACILYIIVVFGAKRRGVVPS